MKRQLWLLLIALIGISAYLGRHALTSSAQTRTTSPAAQPAFSPPLPPSVPLVDNAKFIGAGSCAATACHNGNYLKGLHGSEYTYWIGQKPGTRGEPRDPHAKAFEILYDARSTQIQKNLHKPDDLPAYKDQRCLSCHVAPGYLEKPRPDEATHFKSDGVSCESCHGPAKDWINHHHLDVWQFLSAADKKKLGMNDTRSLVGRAQVCVQCHVGTGYLDVDHDLIAAGHPRLHFEFSAFHAEVPHHWSDEKDRARVKGDFDSQAWAIGQLVTAHAALELLAYRADAKNGKAWPEFSDYVCSACHHDLQSPSPRQKAGFGQRIPGSLPWGFYASFAPDVAETVAGAEVRNSLVKLQGLMNQRNPPRGDVATQAADAANALKSLMSRAELVQPEKALHGRLARFGEEKTHTADNFTQMRLAITAFSQAKHRPAISPALIESLSKHIAPAFDPVAIHKRLDETGKKHLGIHP